MSPRGLRLTFSTVIYYCFLCSVTFSQSLVISVLTNVVSFPQRSLVNIMDSEDDIPEVAELSGPHLKQWAGPLGPMNECHSGLEYIADRQMKKEL